MLQAALCQCSLLIKHNYDIVKPLDFGHYILLSMYTCHFDLKSINILRNWAVMPLN
jgi:hypothetical protein